MSENPYELTNEEIAKRCEWLARHVMRDSKHVWLDEAARRLRGLAP
jgi:hypothetical protein